MAEQSVLVLGAGKTGSLITCLLGNSSDYKVRLGKLKLDAAQYLIKELSLKGINVIEVDAQNETQFLSIFTLTGTGRAL